MEASAFPPVPSRVDAEADADADPEAEDLGAAGVLELEAPPEVLLEDDEVFWRGLDSLVDPDVCFP